VRSLEFTALALVCERCFAFVPRSLTRYWIGGLRLDPIVICFPRLLNSSPGRPAWVSSLGDIALLARAYLRAPIGAYGIMNSGAVSYEFSRDTLLAADLPQ
jgi:hypothetical protein